MTETETDYQRTPGRQIACCREMRWALYFGHIKRGYLYQKHNPPRWIGWSLYIKGEGFMDCSPIHFCPFCGKSLDERED